MYQGRKRSETASQLVSPTGRNLSLAREIPPPTIGFVSTRTSESIGTLRELRGLTRVSNHDYDYWPRARRRALALRPRTYRYSHTPPILVLSESALSIKGQRGSPYPWQTAAESGSQ